MSLIIKKWSVDFDADLIHRGFEAIPPLKSVNFIGLGHLTILKNRCRIINDHNQDGFKSKYEEVR